MDPVASGNLERASANGSSSAEVNGVPPGSNAPDEAEPLIASGRTGEKKRGRKKKH